MEALIKGIIQDEKIYKTLIAQIDLKRIENNFSKRKDVLKKAFDDEELYDLYYKYIKEFYEKNKNDKDLLTYQRILLSYI